VPEAEARKLVYTTEKNWSIAEKCIQRLMLWAGVLITEDGHPLVDRIGCNSTIVGSLASDFRRKCEAYLAERIIFRLGGISYDDDPYYLGLTLYRRGGQKPVPPEELKARTDELLTYLQAENKIHMDSDRMIQARPTQPV